MKRFILPILTLAFGLLLSACDGSSPTEPRSQESAGIVVVINDPAGAFAAHHATIRSLIDHALATVTSALPVRSVTIEVMADPSRAIRGLGIGAYTVSPNRVEVVVDPSARNLEQSIAEHVPPIIVHELHHVVRWRTQGHYSTLLEALVTEGLADRFVGELLGTPPQPWSDAFPESQTEFYLDLARPEFDSFFDFNAWFLGSDPRIPQSAGYTLGFRLVRDYQARSGQSAAQLVNTPATAFRPE